jgi:tRNA(Ile2) C34 agmatinyltransferase TiaS
MNSCPVRFCCPACGARIKAPGQLTGQRRNCPRCGREFTVPHHAREDVGPILVLSDAAPAYRPPVAYRRGA